MLSVYISPSGCQKKQVEVLRVAAQQYHDHLKTSTLMASEAYISFFSYLPNLTYPLPCCALTSAQCCFIQAPAFTALLPKLHLNRHSPHTALFAGDIYGGLI
jgi:hypothetical protein